MAVQAHAALVRALQRGDDALAAMLSIGVATVSAVPKNFDAARLVESAMRCLAAARADPPLPLARTGLQR